MLKSILCLWIIFVLSLAVNGQEKSKVIKIRPLISFFAFNPNVSLEKSYFKGRLSAEIEMKYRLRSWAIGGGEGNFGNFHNSEGMMVSLGTKFFYLKSLDYKEKGKPNTPFGMYFGLAMEYSASTIYNIDIKHHNGTYINTVNRSSHWAALHIIPLAFQVPFKKHFTFEIHTGGLLKFDHEIYSKVVRTPIPQEYGQITRRFRSTEITGYTLRMSLGYRF